ncbi:MAG: nucleoside-diphosphate sugar epimerase/dehydratase [Clostridium sp.]
MILLMLSDIALIAFAYAVSCYIRFDVYEFNDYIGIIIKYLPLTIGIYIITLWLFKMYNRIWSTASIDEAINGVLACGIGCSLNFLVMSFMTIRIPRTVTIVAGILITCGVISVRVSYRVGRRLRQYIKMIKKQGKENVLIIGAGVCAHLIITEILREKTDEYNIVGLIDDNRGKVNNYLKGYKILGNRYNIEEICKDKAVDKIIIAIPSLNAENRKEIVEICNNTKLKVKIIPAVYEIIDGKVNLNKMRDVDLKDLLGRPEVKLDREGISQYLEGKAVLVTGAGGSIGSELCRQIAAFKPSKLIMVDIYENNIYEIQNELNRRWPELNKAVIIASVRDKRRMDEIFNRYKPKVVFHAAAHKHVPLMEDSPSEAIKNNVKGTLNVAECADKHGALRFVLISTDKAVNPTNVMGASKRLCEMVIQAMNRKSKTEFVAVRFGNVLGSNGSVIPLFKKQIKEGGPITLTHKEITRYFMLIPEAAQLVLQAGAFASGGEIFVLDMGKPVKIYDLAVNLIKLSGLEPDKDIKIKVTGLRPGEKLYEELLMSEEGLGKTPHEKIFIGKPGDFELEDVKKSIEMIMEQCLIGNRVEIKNAMKQVVPTYKDPEVYNGIQEEIAATLDFVGEM